METFWQWTQSPSWAICWKCVVMIRKEWSARRCPGASGAEANTSNQPQSRLSPLIAGGPWLLISGPPGQQLFKTRSADFDWQLVNQNHPRRRCRSVFTCIGGISWTLCDKPAVCRYNKTSVRGWSPVILLERARGFGGNIFSVDVFKSETMGGLWDGAKC